MYIHMEKAMAPHSSTLAWKIPWVEEPGGLQSMGPRRVRHNWVTSLSLFTFLHWKRKWQPTPVFLPGEFQGPASLVGCPLWGRTESDTTESWNSSSSSLAHQRKNKQTNKNSAQIPPYRNLTETTGPSLGGQKPKGRKKSTVKPEKRTPQTQ